MFIDLSLYFFSSAIDAKTQTITCEGSFSVHWKTKDGEMKRTLFQLASYRVFPPTKFRFLKKIFKRQQHFAYQVDGNCCWALYEGRNRKGKHVILEEGIHWYVKDEVDPIRCLEKQFCE